MMQLFPYQEEGVKFLASRKRALLADDMGLGKSAQAIVAAKHVGSTSVLVVCPASVVENWKREIARFWPGFNLWAVISYDRYSRDHGKVDWLGSAGTLILDEAHYLKSKDAKRTKAVFGPKCDGVGGLVERAKHVFLLTGTPTPNNTSELWPMLRAVMPEAIDSKIMWKGMQSGEIKSRAAGKPLSYWSFVQKYCKTVNNGFGIKIVGSKNSADLKARIAPFVLRRKKEEVLKDLPPIRFDELPLSVSGWRETLAIAEAEMVAVEKALAEHGVAGLKEIAPHVASLRRVTGLAKVAPAVEWIKEWFEAGGKKLVVFAHHRDVILDLYDGLDKAYIEARLVGGWIAQGERQRRVDDFQNPDGAQVFIGQIQAAGVGITLTAASDALFVESSWVPAENEQAAMRIHRIGQRNACLVRFATLAGSIDEDIQRAVMRKTADIAKLFG